jgi:hypothetical protein
MGRGILDPRVLCWDSRGKVIQQYVKNQGRNPENYQKLHEGKQLKLFPY